MPDAHPNPASELVAIGLGSNVGDRMAHVRHAIDAIGRLSGTTVERVSDIIETPPVGPIPQGPYLNACALLWTNRSPQALLADLHTIERARGRDRAQEQRWGPRTLDLDILVFGNRTVSEPGLTIPHPRLQERRFVLVPLAQIAPEMPVPGLESTPGTLLGLLRESELREIPGLGSGTILP